MKIRKFTLIELLVTISVLFVLISLLQPSLSSILNQSKTLTCLNNLKGHGSAIVMYQDDYDGFYPTIRDWGALSGGFGDTRFYGGLRYGPEARTLNLYLNNDPKISQCPSDVGDGWLQRRVNQKIDNCYNNYGTSYLGQFRRDIFRVKHVFHNETPVHQSDLSRLHNKVIIADWPWHPNRKLSFKESQWHSPDSREYNVLFGDGHSELFHFSLDYENPSNYRIRFNPDYLFW